MLAIVITILVLVMPCHCSTDTIAKLNRRIEAMKNTRVAYERALWHTRDQLREMTAYIESTITDSEVRAKRHVTEVDRRSKLSYVEFYQEYAMKSKPVIITDYSTSFFASGIPWTRNHITRTCKGSEVEISVHDPKAEIWAKLAEHSIMPIEKYMKEYAKRESYKDTNELLYLHDVPLPYTCPSLLDDFVMPKYFAPDFLQKVPPKYEDIDVNYVNYWPSLFVGPKGSQSSLHVDAFGSNFWMLALEGRKEWNFFAPQDRLYLYEDRGKSFFNLDTFSPPPEARLFARTKTMHCILQPGELLVVPGGAPHQVRNLDDIVAIAGNYIDGSNYRSVVSEFELEAHAGSFPAEVMLDELRNLDLPQLMSRVPKDLKYADFKKQQPRQ